MKTAKAQDDAMPSVDHHKPERDGQVRRKARRDKTALREIREQLRNLLAAGHTMDAIEHAMSIKHGVRGRPLKRLIAEVTKVWEEEAAARQPYARQAHLHRLQAQIREARDAGAWNAIATLERVAMEVGGTASPPPEPPPSSGLQQHALLVLLGDMPQEKLAALIDREKRLLTDGRKVIDAEAKIIDVDTGKQAVVEKPDSVACDSHDADSGCERCEHGRDGDVADGSDSGGRSGSGVLEDADTDAPGQVEKKI